MYRDESNVFVHSALLHAKVAFSYQLMNTEHNRHQYSIERFTRQKFNAMNKEEIN